MKEKFVLPGIGLLSILVLVGVASILLGRQPQVEGRADISSLPAVNAFLNATSAVLLTVGYLFIRRKKVASHKICMLSAFGVLIFSGKLRINYILVLAPAGALKTVLICSRPKIAGSHFHVNPQGESLGWDS